MPAVGAPRATADEGVEVEGAGRGHVAVAAAALEQGPRLALEVPQLPVRRQRGRPRAEVGRTAPVGAGRQHLLQSSQQSHTLLASINNMMSQQNMH